MLFDKFGFHFLEPIVTFEQKQTVKETPFLIKPDHDLPVPLKLEIIKRENKQRPRYNQVASVLNEILNALENGQSDGHLQKLESKTPIQNKAMVSKLEAAKELEEAERKRSQQFKQRNEFLKKQLPNKDKDQAVDQNGSKNEGKTEA